MFMSSEKANGGGKNMSAPRWVPVHPELFKAGFIDYWETVKAEGHLRLFPELQGVETNHRDEFQKYASEDFKEYRRSVGVGSLTGRGTKAFHSFRATFSTFLDDVNERNCERLIGHTSQGGKSVHQSVYNQKDFNPREMFDFISQLDFGLSHPPFKDNPEMRHIRAKRRRQEARQQRQERGKSTAALQGSRGV
jgi:hypothetical protein